MTCYFLLWVKDHCDYFPQISLCPDSHAYRHNNGIEFQVLRIQTKITNAEVDFTSLDLTHSVW